jgi:hypothetical protein
MPPLDWERFRALRGDPQHNFELLCRGAIRRTYGSKGEFRSTAQQPGVEFHLRLTASAGELGDPPRWWGWQCRWYDLPGGRQIGSTRREKIVEAIRKTENWLPDVTDWVLFTRRPLTPTDQAWFFDIETQMTLHVRTGEDDLPDLLEGDAADLRAAYFGELVLSPQQLVRLRAEGIEAVKRRYNPDVYVKVEAEKVLEQVLGRPGSWRALSVRATNLRKKATQLRADQRELARDDAAHDAIGQLLEDATTVETRLRDIATELEARGPERSAELADTTPPVAVQRGQAEKVMAALRIARQPAALGVHMLEAELRRARRLLDGFAQRVRPQIVAVVGGPGRGKSNLAIDLTAEADGAPAGIYLQGRNLPRTGGLEDLLTPVISRPGGTFKQLLEAVDAAGAREGRRIPLVIDGLNEAEYPARFKPLLSSLKISAADFPNVLVLLTLRESAFDYAMPDEAPPYLVLPGFEEELEEAIDRYFTYYKIERGEARLPLRLLRQPLLLWMFCEVANPRPPEERRPVPLSALPASPVALFEAFRDESIKRIATELLGCAISDVAGGLDRVSLALWERNVREIPFDELRDMIDREPDWNRSIARALEDEGVLMREPAPTWERQPSGILFDALAGFLIADAIVRDMGARGIEVWLADKTTLEKLDPTPAKGHPLASDILTALAGVLPARINRQLWPYLDGGRREQALVDAADLDRGQVDTDTADAIAEVLRAGSVKAFRQIMIRLADVRSDRLHRLNAEFVDRALRGMPIVERDLRWTEWLRARNDSGWRRVDGAIQREVEELSRRWRERDERDERDEADRLHALWLAWALTSTDRRLRDHATEALYRYGRGAPNALFDMTLGALELNDPYVPERLLVASYGVIMANQRPLTEDFPAVYESYLRRLGDALRGDGAAHPTTHWLMRRYAQGARDMAVALYSDVAGATAGQWEPPFTSVKAPRGYSEKSAPGKEVAYTFGMDFENYTVGGLYDDRSNYQRSHKGYQDGLAQIRGRIWQLGWRRDSFEKLDRELAEGQWRGGRSDRPDRVDRYGKKYGWIAYYELAGRLDDAGKLSAEASEHIVDIDPSFPDAPSPLPVTVPRWARRTPAKLSTWVRRGVVSVPDELLTPAELDGVPGPWVAVHVSLRDLDHVAGRRAWGLIEALLVTPRVAAGMRRAVASLAGWSDSEWPDDPSDYYTMAGEIPWSPKFAASVRQWHERPYHYEMVLPGLGRFDAEIVTHRFAWESHHSATNQQGGFLVPSRSVSEDLGLLRSPDGLDHVDGEGRPAARVFLQPREFESGNALYLRRDLLEAYAKRRRREVVIVARGERTPDYELIMGRPRWYVNAARERADEWAFARRLRDLA